MTIDWENVRVQSVLDCVGRSFKWTELKGKRIYMCGHGAHIFRDGYCAVPPNTTVNFYQTYGKIMKSTQVYQIIDGSKDYQPERSFMSGQSCPNMTLFDDSGERSNVLGDTVKALKRRLGDDPNHMDHFIFNCNQFSALSVHKPLLPRPVLDRETRKPLQAAPPPETGEGMGQMLKLEEILTVLQGNTIEWVCCQDPNVDRYHVEIGESPKPKMNTGGLSDRVKAGLDAMANVSAEIAESHYVRDRRVLGGQHMEGTWASVPDGKAKIEGNMRPHAWLNRWGKQGMNVQGLRQKAMASRLKINDGLHALEDEPQGNPFKTHQARAELQRGRLVVDNLLRALTGLKA